MNLLVSAAESAPSEMPGTSAEWQSSAITDRSRRAAFLLAILRATKSAEHRVGSSGKRFPGAGASLRQLALRRLDVEVRDLRDETLWVATHEVGQHHNGESFIWVHDEGRSIAANSRHLTTGRSL